MYQDISDALTDQYVMFYVPKWPAAALHPVCTLDQCIREVNHRLCRSGRDLGQWSAGDQDQIARLLWANWIFANLSQEPIRKPVLVHREIDRFVVDCGDTRLMALELVAGSAEVSVVITDLAINADRYQGWTAIRNSQELREACGFGADAEVLFNVVHTDHAIDWLEIGDATTAHHLHNVDQRIRMMQHYLDQQDSGFLFDRAWAQSSIEWSEFDQDRPTSVGNHLTMCHESA